MIFHDGGGIVGAARRPYHAEPISERPFSFFEDEAGSPGRASEMNYDAFRGESGDEAECVQGAGCSRDADEISFHPADSLYQIYI